MKVLFGKDWWIFPLLASVLCVFAVVIQLTRQTDEFSEWLFTFLKDWAVILSAATGLLIVIGVFMGIIENRRTQAKARIRAWAEAVLQLMALSGDSREKDKKLEELDLQSYSVLVDAESIGGVLQTKTAHAVVKLTQFHTWMSDEHKSEDGKLDQTFLESVFNSLYDVIDIATGVSRFRKYPKSSGKTGQQN